MAKGEKGGNLQAGRTLQQADTGWLYAYILVFILCALIFQIKSSVPPWKDASPIEYFISSLLWMLSLTCLQIATENLSAKGRALFWLAACGALAILAMDEIFAYHEHTEQLLGDDDYFKIALVLMAGGVLYFLCWLEAAPSLVGRILLAGYLVQILWILDDMGDGDFFRLPFPIHVLWWAEEILELLSMAIYLLGFQALLAHIRRRQQLAPAPLPLDEKL
jgi:hypothetical protein